MGLLVDGQWQDQWYDTEESKERFVRSAAQFRNWVTGRPDPFIRFEKHALCLRLWSGCSICLTTSL